MRFSSPPLKIHLLVLGLLAGWIHASSQGIYQTFELGEAALEQGRPQEAVRYFKRVLFFAQDDIRQKAYERLSAGHEALGEPTKALHYLELAYYNERNDSIRQALSFRQVQQYLILNNLQQARRVLNRMRRSPLSEQQADRCTFFQSTLWYIEGNYAQAFSGFQELVTDDSLRAELSRVFSTSKRLKRPHPVTAFWLSLVPGLGQVYAGHPGQAVNNTVLNGTIFTLAVILGRTVDPSEAVVVMLTLGTRYYQGGMERARRLAIRKRQQKQAEHWQKVLNILEHNRTHGK
ncbi:MAG: hypothetical protein AAGI38_07380 [Bacteroidota bacterium]